MEVAPVIVFVGVLIFVAHFFTGLFSKTKIPDVLLLIIIGLLIGPLFNIVNTRDFGSVGPVFTTITLVVILFEGGIGLDLRVLKSSFRSTITLTIFTFILSMSAVALISYYYTGLDLTKSFMLGAIVGSISPAVIIPFLKQLQMSKEGRTVIIMESALSDVISIVITFAFIETLRLGSISPGHMVGRIISSFFLASIIGFVGGVSWSILLNKLRTIQNSIFTTPAFVFVIFGITEMIGYSGAIAALSFGISIGNIELFNLSFLKKYIPHEPISLNETEKIFFSEVVFLLKTFFFVYMGLCIKFSDIWSLAFGFFITCIIFIIRIPVVRLSINKTFLKYDVSLMSVMIPKGLAAAVLASIPIQSGIAGGELIQNITYSVVFISILITSVMVFLIQKTKISSLYNSFFSGYKEK